MYIMNSIAKAKNRSVQITLSPQLLFPPSIDFLTNSLSHQRRYTFRRPSIFPYPSIASSHKLRSQHSISETFHNTLKGFFARLPRRNSVASAYSRWFRNSRWFCNGRWMRTVRFRSITACGGSTTCTSPLGATFDIWFLADFRDSAGRVLGLRWVRARAIGVHMQLSIYRSSG